MAVNKKMQGVANNNVVMLDDGTREIVLVNTFGKEICRLHFRTADVSIYERYKALMGDFESIVKPLSDLSINRDGTSSVDHDFTILKMVEDNLKQKINELFDMDEADLLFATRNPFSSVGGKFFAEHVLDALGGVIAKAINEEAKLSEQRVQKYLSDIKDVNANAGTTPAST